MNKWQPIATAPKDGTNILAAEIRDNRILFAAVIWWGDHDSADSEYGTVAHTPHFGWLMSDGHNDPMWCRGFGRLTHWRLLPGDEP